jgi:hypothetical protein
VTGQQQFLIGSGGVGEGAPQNQSGGINSLFNSDGTNTVGFTAPTPPNWYSIAPQTGVGDFYWIKVTDTGGTGTAAALTGFSVSGFTSLSAGGPQASIPSGIGTRTYSYQLSSSSSGSPVVASGTATIANNI